MSPDAAQPAPGTYVLDPARTTIRFDTVHMFGLGKVHGTFGLTGGEVRVAAAPEDSSVTAEIDAAAFETGSKGRDRTVRSRQYLDTANHPSMTFVSREVRAGDGGRWNVTGDLTVQRTTRPVELVVELHDAGAAELRCRATTRVDRYAFGITGGKGITGRYLDLTLDVTATPRPTAA